MKREILNECRLSFPSLSVNESYARAAAAAFAAQADPTVRELSEIKTAVSEAFSNAAIHGYENRGGIVKMEFSFISKDTIMIKVMDSGIGIENIAKAMEPLYTTDTDQNRSGMGFTVMESFMDKLQVKSEEGKGTAVTMTKYLDLVSAL